MGFAFISKTANYPLPEFKAQIQRQNTHCVAANFEHHESLKLDIQLTATAWHSPFQPLHAFHLRFERREGSKKIFKRWCGSW